MSCYGGHIWNCANAINELYLQKEIFEAGSVLGSSIFSNVSICLRAEYKEKPMPGIQELLEEVARFGFASIPDEDDPRARIASEKNVLGVVDARAVVVGVPYNLREGKKTGVVPSSQSMRLVIAETLCQSPSNFVE